MIPNKADICSILFPRIEAPRRRAPPPRAAATCADLANCAGCHTTLPLPLDAVDCTALGAARSRQWRPFSPNGPAFSRTHGARALCMHRGLRLLTLRHHVGPEFAHRFSSSAAIASTMPPAAPLRVGLLGAGAINGRVAEALATGEAGPAQLAAVLVRTERAERPPYAGAEAEVCLTTDEEAFYASDWSLCVEAAGQPAVVQHAKRCLSMGRDFMITSIGALCDQTLYDDLQATAAANGSRLILCTGSMPAVDWMGAAAIAGCDSVTVTQTKPPKAWMGTPGEKVCDLMSLTQPSVLFEGPARAAAALYPKNANVSAMLGIATAGLDATVVKLVADPTASGNLVILEFNGPAGSIKVEVQAAPSLTNPRTSMVVALSVIKAVKKLCPGSAVIVGL